MQAPFLALITPLASPGVPTHPIAPGGPPPRPWGPINYPDQGLPGNQPYPDQSLPGQQPGIWGPIFYPDQGLPGNQPYPDQGLPGSQPRPTHPIYYPPYPTTGPGFPTAPIVLPPSELPPQPVGPDKMVIVVFVPTVGYKLFVVDKPQGYNPPTGPSTEIPTPQ